MSTEKMQWFRLYAEIVDDENLRLLAFEDRWHFVAILALKCAGLLDRGEDNELLHRRAAVKMGLAVRELAEVARRLAEVGLIDQLTLQPTRWDSRQFKSDTSTERVRAHRERVKRDETFQKRVPPVPVTPPETETETETDIPPEDAGVHAHETDAGRACRLMREAGCAHTNPGHPNLLVALAEGVTPEALDDTAREGADAGKTNHFAWAIAAARGRHAEAAKPRASPSRARNKQEAIEARNRDAARQWLDQESHA